MKELVLITLMKELFLTLIIGIPCLIFIVLGYIRVLITAAKTDAGFINFLLIILIPFYAAYFAVKYDDGWFGSHWLTKLWAIVVVIVTLVVILYYLPFDLPAETLSI